MCRRIFLSSRRATRGAEMMNIAIENSLMEKRTMSSVDVLREKKKHWSIGIGLFLTLGIVAMVTGLILAAESYLGMVIESDMVANVSAFLLIVSLPMLSLGAQCMDKVSTIEQEERES